MTGPMRLFSTFSLLTVWGLLTSPMAVALETAAAPEVSNEQSLRPYVAHYKTRAYGMSMNLTRSLVLDEGQYTLQQTGKNLLLSITEVAHFSVQHDQIVGQDFHYQMKSLKNRERRVEFLPGKGLIRSLRDDVWTEHPWQPEILDRLSQQVQIRLALKAAQVPLGEIQLQVIDGPRVRDKHFVLVGEESLETALGTLDTLHYRQKREDSSKRESDVWLAPSLDYLNVLTVHVEKGKEIEVALKAVTFEPGDGTEQADNSAH